VALSRLKPMAVVLDISVILAALMEAAEAVVELGLLERMVLREQVLMEVAQLFKGQHRETR